MTLESPNKRVKIEAIKFDDVKSKKAVVEEPKPEEDLDTLRQRWVGDVTLPERESRVQFFFSTRRWYLPVVATDMEPLLTESKRRFVLFPIQYHEVRVSLLLVRVCLI